MKTLQINKKKEVKNDDKSIDAYRVAWRLELASSISGSGSGDGFGDLDDDCIGVVDESWDGGASNLLMVQFFSNSFSSFYVLLSLARYDDLFRMELFTSLFIYSIHISNFTFPKKLIHDVNLEDNKSL